MQCDICFRTGGSKLPFLCPTDARNQLYEGRIQNARILIEKDALDQQIITLLSKVPATEDESSSSSADSKLRLELSESDANKAQAIDRTQQIIAQADELRVKINGAREEIAKRKAALTRRKSELASASSGIEARRNRQIEDVEKGIRMTKYKWNQGHATTASSRAFLCGEAAKLYGLKRTRRASGTEEYKIGGVAIVDLKSLNSASPVQVSTALSHVVHLLMLSTHYLAIRLPAEITLPHRDYPLPTIFPLSSSYKYTDVPFPGSAPAQSSNPSPTESRHADQGPLPRPRPLFIKKQLPMLAAEDPAGYGFFLEGVTLLAYNIAWVCKSQGIPVGDDSSFEEICNLGRNLYNLLLGPRSRSSATSRTPSTTSTPTKSNKEFEGEREREEKKPPLSSLMGKYSHGSAHSSLASAEGTEFIRSWKLLSPRNLADKLRSKLMSEVATAEWEFLDEGAWTPMDEMGDDGVVIGARTEGERVPGGFGGMQSFMSMRTVMDAVEMVGGSGEGERERERGGERRQGVNGWMKLRDR